LDITGLRFDKAGIKSGNRAREFKDIQGSDYDN
jgi:hypothetical protein